MSDTFFFISSLIFSLVMIVVFSLMRLNKITKKRKKAIELGLLHLTLFTVFSLIWFLVIAIDGFSQVFGVLFYLLFYVIAYSITMTLVFLNRNIDKSDIKKDS